MRFSPYGNHQRSWFLHADVSNKFKEWCQSSEYNKSLFEKFVEDPEAFLYSYSSERDK